MELFTSAGRHGWETKIKPYFQGQKAEKVSIHSVVIHRLKNEAEGLISLDSYKIHFLGFEGVE